MSALLQRELGDGFLVESAGLDRDLAGRPANYRAVDCLQQRGLDLSEHVSRWIGTSPLMGSDGSSRSALKKPVGCAHTLETAPSP